MTFCDGNSDLATACKRVVSDVVGTLGEGGRRPLELSAEGSVTLPRGRNFSGLGEVSPGQCTGLDSRGWSLFSVCDHCRGLPAYCLRSERSRAAASREV